MTVNRAPSNSVSDLTRWLACVRECPFLQPDHLRIADRVAAAVTVR